MTVSELIRKLQEFPEDMTVLINASCRTEGYAEAGPPCERHTLRITLGSGVIEWVDSPDPIKTEEITMAQARGRTIERLKILLL